MIILALNLNVQSSCVCVTNRALIEINTLKRICPDIQKVFVFVCIFMITFWFRKHVTYLENPLASPLLEEIKTKVVQCINRYSSPKVNKCIKAYVHCIK